MMPMKSQAQRGAMFAAKAGKSTLGIPQSVGAEFAAADKGGKLPARMAEGGAVQRSESTEKARDLAKAESNAKELMADEARQTKQYGPVGGRGPRYETDTLPSAPRYDLDPRATARDYAKGGPVFRKGK